MSRAGTKATRLITGADQEARVGRLATAHLTSTTSASTRAVARATSLKVPSTAAAVRRMVSQSTGGSVEYRTLPVEPNDV